jgi:hypothetical protein
MSAQVGKDIKGQVNDKGMKKAPAGFDDEDDDMGDIEDQVDNRGRPGPNTKYQTETSKGMAMDKAGNGS